MKNINDLVKAKQKNVPVSFSIKPDTHLRIQSFKKDFGIASMSGIIEDLILDFMKHVRKDFDEDLKKREEKFENIKDDIKLREDKLSNN